jgi:hypothetical protein
MDLGIAKREPERVKVLTATGEISGTQGKIRGIILELISSCVMRGV